jgi:Tfp pilus assembly protein PilF
VSIGDRVKARHHLLRAVELAPNFPANRLNLLESFVLWGEKPEARLQLKRLDALLPAARTNFTGPNWAAEWADWDQRIARARRALLD